MKVLCDDASMDNITQVTAQNYPNMLVTAGLNGKLSFSLYTVLVIDK
jgi:hypothetical protein